MAYPSGEGLWDAAAICVLLLSDRSTTSGGGQPRRAGSPCGPAPPDRYTFVLQSLLLWPAPRPPASPLILADRRAASEVRPCWEDPPDLLVCGMPTALSTPRRITRVQPTLAVGPSRSRASKFSSIADDVAGGPGPGFVHPPVVSVLWRWLPTATTRRKALRNRAGCEGPQRKPFALVAIFAARREIMGNMFALWQATEDDLLDPALRPRPRSARPTCAAPPPRIDTCRRRVHRVAWCFRIHVEALVFGGRLSGCRGSQAAPYALWCRLEALAHWGPSLNRLLAPPSGGSSWWWSGLTVGVGRFEAWRGPRSLATARAWLKIHRAKAGGPANMLALVIALVCVRGIVAHCTGTSHHRTCVARAFLHVAMFTHDSQHFACMLAL